MSRTATYNVTQQTLTGAASLSCTANDIKEAACGSGLAVPNPVDIPSVGIPTTDPEVG
ncbi:hypothetical protein GCM10022238_00890 [Gordonia hankookensis]